MPLLREQLFRSNPVPPSLEARQATGCLCFGKIADIVNLFIEAMCIAELEGGKKLESKK